MLRNLIAYYDAAQKAVENGDTTWAKAREATSEQWYALGRMKFEDPADGEEPMKKKYKALYDEIQEKFRNLTE